MSIVYHESSKIFHLYNQTISYIMMVLPNGHMGQLYYGKKIRDKEDFSYLLELAPETWHLISMKTIAPFHLDILSWSTVLTEAVITVIRQ